MVRLAIESATSFRAEELAQRALDIVREQYATGAEPSLGVQGAKMLAERVARITKKLAKARARLEDDL